MTLKVTGAGWVTEELCHFFEEEFGSEEPQERFVLLSVVMDARCQCWLPAGLRTLAAPCICSLCV